MRTKIVVAGLLLIVLVGGFAMGRLTAPDPTPSAAPATAPADEGLECPEVEALMKMIGNVKAEVFTIIGRGRPGVSPKAVDALRAGSHCL